MHTGRKARQVSIEFKPCDYESDSDLGLMRYRYINFMCLYVDFFAYT